MKPPRVEWKGCAKSRPCAVNRENWAYDFRARAADLAARSRSAYNFEEVRSFQRLPSIWSHTRLSYPYSAIAADIPAPPPHNSPTSAPRGRYETQRLRIVPNRPGPA